MIPEFPSALPIEEPDHVPAPAPVMSRKSTFEMETIAAEIVRAVPWTEEYKRTRSFCDGPFALKVPVTVRVPERLIAIPLDPELTAIVRFANVEADKSV